MLKEQSIALDLRRYDTPNKLSSLVYDTASLAIEASNTDMARANPHFFIKTKEEKVIVPGKDKRDVSEMYDKDDSTTIAGEKIRRLLMEDDGNFTYVWISPPEPSRLPEPWFETRIEIGVKKITRINKLKYIKSYGISTTLSQDDCLKLGQLLVSISPTDYPFPQNSDDLRSLVMKFEVPEGKDSFKYLSEIIKLPEKEIFESILNGTADKNKAKAVKTATIATRSIRNNPELIYMDHIRYGAYIETEMQKRGFGMDTEKSGCGSLNSTLLNTSSYFETQTPVFGFSDEHGSLNFECPSCKKTNTRPTGQLLSNCQHCGANVGC